MSSRQYNITEDRGILGHNPLFLHHVRSSRSESSNGSHTRDSSSVSSLNTSDREQAELNREPQFDEVNLDSDIAKSSKSVWVPYTFRHYYLGTLTLVTFGLCLVTFLLWWRSSTNYGLGRDDGSSALLFGWRFSPTMIAVIYVQMTAVLLGDVKRTEPFARLAQPQGAEASQSILKTPGAWWNALWDGFSKQKNGRRSWVLVCSALVNIIGFMAVSSLSSAFLFSEDVIVPKPNDFVTLSPVADTPLPINADRTTNFRALANLLQNVSTSPWITDEYTILPFWPAGLSEEPITSLPTISSQTWEANTIMFKSEVTCTKLDLKSVLNHTVSFPNVPSDVNRKIGHYPAVSAIWSSSDGCEYGLAVAQQFWQIGGGSWSDASTFEVGLDILQPSLSQSKLVNSTQQCDGKEIIVVAEPWILGQEAPMEAQLCDTEYYMANVTASIALAGDDPKISFDEAQFESRKVPVPDTMLNATDFRAAMLDPNWPTYMISVLWSNEAVLGGPSVLLGALYNYNMTAIVRDPNLASSISKSKQRYLGEVIQAALNQQGASQKASTNGIIHETEPRVVVQAGPAIALGVFFAVSLFLIVAVWFLLQSGRRPLNLKQDPAASVGVAHLLSHMPLIRSEFQVFRQPSQKDLDENLGGECFYTDSNGLSRLNAANDIKQNTSQSQSGTPALLRLPALIGLAISLAAVIIGIAVLYHFAETDGLYEKAFVYQVHLSFFSNGISSVAPFSIIPTLIATGIGLWWSALDDNLRRLGPYLAMSNGRPPISRGADLSYQSSFWMWACVKAVMNKHWLLALFTLGSTLSPIFTTSMSALLERGPGNVIKPMVFNRSLEIRKIPMIFPTEQAMIVDTSNDYAGNVLSDLYSNLSSHWMYTATIQLTLNGSEPSWSKDGWSFVPVGFDSSDKLNLPNDLDDTDKVAGGSISNVTITTPAMRGRVDCTEYSVQSLTNLSIWLTPKNLKSDKTYNQSTIPDGLEGGWLLGAIDSPNVGHGITTYPAAVLPYEDSLESLQNTTNGPELCDNCTTIFPNPQEIVCCKNGSSNDRSPGVAVGYWSPNVNPNWWTVRNWNQNFTAKWIHGEAVTGIQQNNQSGVSPFIYPSPPSVTMMNCRPFVESANAELTVNPVNGKIQNFKITNEPQELPEAFSDNFLPHNKTYLSREDSSYHYNVTLSYGRLFMASMLTAADTLHIGGVSHISGYNYEDLRDNTYNIRDELNGLNMDFMTYSMYSMAGKDPAALLDVATFRKLTEKTFTTFFQHFVSNNVSLETGGWGYQSINASLPSSLGPALQLENHYNPGKKPSKFQDVMHPISHTNRTAAAHISQRVELLQMNAVAVWLSIGILSWLIITTAVVAVLQKRYFGSLVRNVESLGDVLVLIAGSSNFLQVAREIETGKLSSENYENLKTRLGWFIDESGELRWGIEMDESYGEGPDVNWVSKPSFSKEKGASTWNIAADENNLE